MQNWITKQTRRGLSQFDISLELHHPEWKQYTSNPSHYLDFILNRSNFSDSLKALNLCANLSGSKTVLDLGCGGGWLTARLSVMRSVEVVYALDSSEGFLNSLLPGVVAQMGGNSAKIETIQGFFKPLLFPAGSLDAIIASSVLHHAENLASLLRECKEKLKPGGQLYILNETPTDGFRHLASTTKAFLRIFTNLSLKRYVEASPSISSSGYHYDPQLGDRDYPLWYWYKAIVASGFILESFVDTDLPTIKGKPGRSLKHFVCRVP